MKTRLAIAGLALIGLGLAACGGSDPPRAAEATSFAAAVTGTDAFLGTVAETGGGRVLAYICDGKDIATWFKGQTGGDGTVDLTSADGARLTGHIDGGRFDGAVTLSGGATHTVSAATVQAPAGLYRTSGQVDGQPAVGGWIVLPDGGQRGAVRTSTGFTSTDTDLARPPKPVTSFTANETDF